MIQLDGKRDLFNNSSPAHTMPQSKLILASTSKIRQAVLENAGLVISCKQPNLDEHAAKAKLGSISPKSLAQALAEQKSLSLECRDGIIIGADQTLSCNSTIFHKPKSLSAARAQLLELRGKTHSLHSALACAQNGKIIWSICDDARLTMRDFSNDYVDHYIKACGDDILSSVGSYKLEKQGVQLFEKIEGDYFTILGLPLLPLLAFLRDHKILPI
jgi:septum formation protein